MIYRGPAKPLPINFKTRFIEGGWKLVEKHYGSSNPMLMAWWAMAGGSELDSQRRAVQRTGRKAGGNVGVSGG